MKLHLRLLLIGALCLVGMSNLYYAAQSLQLSHVYSKDFSSPFLLARAALTGTNPYLPLNELAHLLDPSRPVRSFPHSSPHPPPVVLAFIPLGLLEYRAAAALWFALEVICLLISATLLINWWGARRAHASVVVLSLALLSWEPVRGELAWGQMMLPLFLLLLVAWLSLREGRDVRGGLLLGLVCALKLLVVPLILYLAIAGRWRAFAATCGVVALSNMLAAVVVGFGPVYFYYSEVGGEVAALYRARIDNFSLYALAWRTFEGTHDSLYGMLPATPLLYLPALAQPVSLALPAALVIVALVTAHRARNLDTAFSLLICASITTMPVAWDVYLIWLLIPLVVFARRVCTLNFPRRETLWLIAIVIILFSHRALFDMINAILPPPLSYVAASISFAPLIATLLLMALLADDRHK